MLLTRRKFVGGVAMASGAHSLHAQVGRVFTPEQFGAIGDGRTNDSAAMAKLARAVNLAGGGRVVFRKVVYLVGSQTSPAQGKFEFAGDDLLFFAGCRLPLALEGNGARLLCRSGLRYGVFSSDGIRREHQLPYSGTGVATPYRAMIEIKDCLSSVSITDFELEGPGEAVMLGGRYGDQGWQVPGSGIILRNNRGSEVIARVRTHRHPLDGLYIDGLDAVVRDDLRSVLQLISEHNGRQACSIVGGKNYEFLSCDFQHTASGKMRSPPGAGVDIEAQRGKSIRDLKFSDCRFINNYGAGLVADTGDTERVHFERCTFIGTKNWSAWPNKPSFSFTGCLFVGALTKAYGDEQTARATRFTKCRFTDNPALSPTEKVFSGNNSRGPLADISRALNVTFDRCQFTATTGVLPWSTRAIYRDCRMVQGGAAIGYPRGRFEGSNTIAGRVDLSGSTFTGTITLNRKLLNRS